MRILLTGASSFTGSWFAAELAGRGHEVTCTLRSPSYCGVRARRVERVRRVARCVEGVAFGDDTFLTLLEEGWDVVCHHGAHVTGYRSPGFDVPAALAANTRSADVVAAAVPRVVLTGSIFEPGEGSGDEPHRAFSPYGLSKAFTHQTFLHHCRAAGCSLGRVVLPNPFGPLEEERFTTGLVRAWLRGETGVCRTPAYVRDNIHVSLLARAYAAFVEAVPAGGWSGTLRPSGYRESQGEFSLRFAAEIGGRLEIETPVELRAQDSFDEPRRRVNTDDLDTASLDWHEAAAWDELAAYYASLD